MVVRVIKAPPGPQEADEAHPGRLPVKVGLNGQLEVQEMCF
jgi:hypothetical protein